MWNKPSMVSYTYLCRLSSLPEQNLLLLFGTTCFLESYDLEQVSFTSAAYLKQKNITTEMRFPRFTTEKDNFSVSQGQQICAKNKKAIEAQAWRVMKYSMLRVCAIVGYLFHEESGFEYGVERYLIISGFMGMMFGTKSFKGILFSLSPDL